MITSRFLQEIKTYAGVKGQHGFNTLLESHRLGASAINIDSVQSFVSLPSVSERDTRVVVAALESYNQLSTFSIPQIVEHIKASPNYKHLKEVSKVVHSLELAMAEENFRAYDHLETLMEALQSEIWDTAVNDSYEALASMLEGNKAALVVQQTVDHMMSEGQTREAAELCLLLANEGKDIPLAYERSYGPRAFGDPTLLQLSERLNEMQGVVVDDESYSRVNTDRVSHPLGMVLVEGKNVLVQVAGEVLVLGDTGVRLATIHDIKDVNHSRLLQLTENFYHDGGEMVLEHKGMKFALKPTTDYPGYHSLGSIQDVNGETAVGVDGSNLITESRGQKKVNTSQSIQESEVTFKDDVFGLTIDGAQFAPNDRSTFLGQLMTLGLGQDEAFGVATILEHSHNIASLDNVYEVKNPQNPIDTAYVIVHEGYHVLRSPSRQLNLNMDRDTLIESIKKGYNFDLSHFLIPETIQQKMEAVELLEQKYEVSQSHKELKGINANIQKIQEHVEVHGTSDEVQELLSVLEESRRNIVHKINVYSNILEKKDLDIKKMVMGADKETLEKIIDDEELDYEIKDSEGLDHTSDEDLKKHRKEIFQMVFQPLIDKGDGGEIGLGLKYFGKSESKGPHFRIKDFNGNAGVYKLTALSEDFNGLMLVEGARIPSLTSKQFLNTAGPQVVKRTLLQEYAEVAIDDNFNESSRYCMIYGSNISTYEMNENNGSWTISHVGGYNNEQLNRLFESMSSRPNTNFSIILHETKLEGYHIQECTYEQAHNYDAALEGLKEVMDEKAYKSLETYRAAYGKKVDEASGAVAVDLDKTLYIVAVTPDEGSFYAEAKYKRGNGYEMVDEDGYDLGVANDIIDFKETMGEGLYFDYEDSRVEYFITNFENIALGIHNDGDGDASDMMYRFKLDTEESMYFDTSKRFDETKSPAGRRVKKK